MFSGQGDRPVAARKPLPQQLGQGMRGGPVVGNARTKGGSQTAQAAAGAPRRCNNAGRGSPPAATAGTTAAPARAIIRQGRPVVAGYRATRHS